jgi:hypothetical protein
MIEPSLDFPPVYRHMLAGGPERLRLSRSGIALLLIGSLALATWLAIPGLLGASGFEGMAFSTLIGAVLTGWFTGGIAARWIGSGPATLAGLVYLSAVAARPNVIDGPWSAVAVAAVGLFALATVPGRLPVDSRRGVGLAFYVVLSVATMVAGPIGPSSILLIGAAMVLVSQNPRGLKLFVHPLGITILASSPLAWWLACQAGMPGVWNGEWVQPLAQFAFPSEHPWLGFAELPIVLWLWFPFAVVALIIGFRQGHMAAPFWRFIGCWIVAPTGLAIFGILAPPAAMDMLLPPLAIVVAMGIHACLLGGRRVWRARGS